MLSLRERACNVARALANFDSCASWPFTAATVLSRATITSAASMMFMAHILRYRRRQVQHLVRPVLQNVPTKSILQSKLSTLQGALAVGYQSRTKSQG